MDPAACGKLSTMAAEDEKDKEMSVARADIDLPEISMRELNEDYGYSTAGQQRNDTEQQHKQEQQQQQQQLQPPQIQTSSSTDIKKSAVKELIERYFYQLQRGCGNPRCSNINCASSGRVSPMTPNEIAAKAIQLLSQDAKLCYLTNQQQPPKMPRTAGTAAAQDSPSSSRSLTVMELCSAQEPHSSGSSSSMNSIITSDSSSSSSNTNISSCATDELPSSVGPFGEVEEVEESSEDSDEVISRGSSVKLPTLPYLDEQSLDQLIVKCEEVRSYTPIVLAINQVFSNVARLSQSFKRPPLAKMTNTANASKLQEILGKSPQDLKKEDLRTLEGEHDKDEDCSFMRNYGAIASGMHCSADGGEEEEEIDPEANGEDEAGGGNPIDEDDTDSLDLDNVIILANSDETQVDLESLRRVKRTLFGLDCDAVREALNRSILLLAEGIKCGANLDWERVLHCFVICFDMATTSSNHYADLEYLERSLPKLCQAAQSMPVTIQARLARIWSAHCKDQLRPLVQCFQQLITMQVIFDDDTVQDNIDVIAITKILKIAFYANILAGEREPPKNYDNTESFNSNPNIEEASSSSGAHSGEAGATNNYDDGMFVYFPYSSLSEDQLEKELNVSCMDCRVPLVPFEDFYNDLLSEAIQMDRDYLSYKNLSLDPLGEENHFSFMLYSFVLTPATKVVALYYDSRIRMYSERNSSLFALLNYYNDGSEVGVRPDLKLKVRRDNIVNDALIGLEMVALSNPKDLKKQLVVEFVGEQGIDEGGVSKEFFQLIVEEIFNPDFGMFTHQDETNTMWFNTAPFENGSQFVLIGIIIGLAIYNNIILAVNFPMVVYRKLMGGQGSFYDLKDWNPTLYRSLKSMLDYQEPDMEDVFMQTFKICYKNVFDETVEHELKPGGGDIVVGQDNKQEFVDLYSDFLLNASIERQFKAFKKGFDMVTDESPLKLLFRPEEIELLVCGSRNFDFVELEQSTEYEGGYTKNTPIIKDFWSIVHNLAEDSKRKLLEFTTGSDRIPVGGLSRLKLLITRHGSDSDRLPTSHTCFNVLLLPEYSSKEKLEERLLKAINYSKGFGML